MPLKGGHVNVPSFGSNQPDGTRSKPSNPESTENIQKTWTHPNLNRCLAMQHRGISHDRHLQSIY